MGKGNGEEANSSHVLLVKARRHHGPAANKHKERGHQHLAEGAAVQRANTHKKNKRIRKEQEEGIKKSDGRTEKRKRREKE
jgi:hypothetical protein